MLNKVVVFGMSLGISLLAGQLKPFESYYKIQAQQVQFDDYAEIYERNELGEQIGRIGISLSSTEITDGIQQTILRVEAIEGDIQGWTANSYIDVDEVEIEPKNSGVQVLLDEADFNSPAIIYSDDSIAQGDFKEYVFKIRAKDEDVELDEATAFLSIDGVFNNNNSKIDRGIEPSELLNMEDDRVDDVEFDYKITDKWYGGYRVEIDISAIKDVSNWQEAFFLPEDHVVSEVYGVLISKPGVSQAHNFIGEDWNNSLNAGEQQQAVLIVEGNPNEAFMTFDDYFEEYGVPQYSSFTEEQRQSWKAESIATNIENSSTENQDNNISSESDFNNTTESELAAINTDAAIEEIESSVNIATSKSKGMFNYSEVLQKNWLFWMANRSGEMGEDNILKWRSDSTLNDGSDNGVDLEGGYFDAGDHIKFIQPMSYSITLLAWSGVDYNEAYRRSGQLDELLNAVKHGTDYFLKTHETDSAGKTKRLWVQVADKSDHYQWIAPEEVERVFNEMGGRKSYYIDRERPGTEAAAGTASALASASMLFRGIDNTYADKLLKNAIALYEFAETYRAKYSDSVPEASPMYTSWSGYEDELVLGAVWLYRATGDRSYLTDKAESYFYDLIGDLGTYTYGADDHSYAAVTLLAKESDDPFFKKEFVDWANGWIEGKEVSYTPGGLAVRTNWGSAPLALSSSFLMGWYNDFVEPNLEFDEFAIGQLNYILGDNPPEMSYVIGFGDRYPLAPHHRGSHPINGSNPTDPAQNLLVGALVGGPGSSDDFSHNDRRDDFKTNEVATGYNAPLAAATIRAYDKFGGKSLSNSELSQIPGVDAN